MNDDTAMSLTSAIGMTLTAQGERVAAFKAWDAAVAEYLKNGEVATYRLQVNALSFSILSR